MITFVPSGSTEDMAENTDNTYTSCHGYVNNYAQYPEQTYGSYYQWNTNVHQDQLPNTHDYSQYSNHYQQYNEHPELVAQTQHSEIHNIIPSYPTYPLHNNEIGPPASRESSLNLSPSVNNSIDGIGARRSRLIKIIESSNWHNIFMRCMECGFFGKDCDDIENHKLTMHKGFITTCRYCGIIAFDTKTLKQHVNEAHPEIFILYEHCTFLHSHSQTNQLSPKIPLSN